VLVQFLFLYLIINVIGDFVKIGIDIDDTICYSIENMLPYICDFYNLDFEKEKKKCLAYDAYFDLPNYFEFATSTYDKVMPYAKMKENANYFINLLSELGYEIVFITARNNYGFKEPYKISKDYLEKNNFHYDKLIIGAIEKGKICKDEKIDIFIDDSIKNCISVNNEGIKVFIFDNEFNRDCYQFERVNNWEDAYNKILKIKKPTK